MADVSIRDVKEQPVMQPLQLPAIGTLWARLVDARRHGLRFPLLAALAILGSAWLFLGVLEDVATRDPLVDVDVIVHGVLQKLQTPWMDSAMVAATELGDVQVLLPVILASLAWFVWRRLWRTCLYWLAAVGVAEVLVKVLKVALHRSRPGSFYDGVEGFAFPSGHATMSVVAYGFLAFLICRKQRAPVRLLIATTTAFGIALIALSSHGVRSCCSRPCTMTSTSTNGSPVATSSRTPRNSHALPKITKAASSGKRNPWRLASTHRAHSVLIARS